MRTSHRLIASLSLITLSACSSTTAPTTTTTVALSRLSQASIDANTANNIINASVDIYNQNVAGRTQSAYNGQTVACPNGGTVLIQGLATKATNSNLTTVDLTYTMTNCKAAQTQQTFTYSGVMTNKGSFDISTNFVSETLKSTGSVTMNGTIKITGFEDAVVSQTASFTINRGYNTASGDIAGRPFSY